MKRKPFFTPSKIYLFIGIAFLIFIFIYIPIIIYNTHNGSPIPLDLIAEGIDLFVQVFFIAAVLMPFIFKNWFKKNKALSLIGMIISGFFVFILYFNK